MYLKAPVQRHRRHGCQTKRNVFRSFLKHKGRFMSRTEAGRVFQTCGPATLKDRSPIAVRDLGTYKQLIPQYCMPPSKHRACWECDFHQYVEHFCYLSAYCITPLSTAFLFYLNTVHSSGGWDPKFKPFSTGSLQPQADVEKYCWP